MKRWRSNLHLCASHYIKITTTILKTPVQPQLQLRSGYCYSCRELASAIIGHHRSGSKMVSVSAVSVGSQVCGVSFCVSECCQMSSRSACGAIRGGCSGTLVLMVALFPRSSVSTIECPIGHPTCPERWLLNGIWGKTLRSTLFARWYVETMLRLCWEINFSKSESHTSHRKLVETWRTWDSLGFYFANSWISYWEWQSPPSIVRLGWLGWLLSGLRSWKTMKQR